MPGAPTQPMTYQYLLDTQAATAEQTSQRVRGVSLNMPSVLDALFQLSYMHRLKPDETGFLSWAHHMLVGAPYTAADLYALWLRGSYLEAVILLRHLVEILVQLRFYRENRETFLSHIRWDMQRRGVAPPPTGPHPQRPKLKTMFDKVAPGFYEPHYGQQLSSTAHAGMNATLYRSELTPDPEPVHQHIPGAHYQERNASYQLRACRKITGIFRRGGKQAGLEVGGYLP